MSFIATILSMRSYSKRVSEHAFNISGIISESNTNSDLGSVISAFDLKSNLYDRLSEPEFSATLPTGRLLYDSSLISETLLPAAFCVLSNQALAAELDQAITRRQLRYLARFKHAEEIDNLVHLAIDERIKLLEKFGRLTDQHFKELDLAYTNKGQTSVAIPQSITATQVKGNLGSRQTGKTEIQEGGAVKQVHAFSTDSTLTQWDDNIKSWVQVTSGSNLSQETTTSFEQDELHHPYIENQIRDSRIKVDLVAELLEAKLTELQCMDLVTQIELELKDIDLEIRKLQSQYIESFLVPRISGVITAVMKSTGEGVRAGEPVLRIEDDSSLLLKGVISSINQVTLGSQCKIDIFDVFVSAPGTHLVLNGKVVFIRGYELDNNKWNVVIEVSNSGAIKLPVGYDFESQLCTVRLTIQ